MGVCGCRCVYMSASMFLSVCVCVCVCVCVHIIMCLFICVPVCVSTFMFVPVSVFIHVCAGLLSTEDVDNFEVCLQAAETLIWSRPDGLTEVSLLQCIVY